MKIEINGLQSKIHQPLTVDELISSLNYLNKKIAIEVNGEIIPRSAYSNKIIVDGDKVEIINAVGGG